MNELREKVAKEDIDRALSHCGYDSVADLHYWAKDDGELNRFDALAEQFAAHRLAALSAVMQDLEAPSEGKALSVDYLRGYLAGLGDLKALTAEEDQYRKEQTP